MVQNDDGALWIAPATKTGNSLQRGFHVRVFVQVPRREIVQRINQNAVRCGGFNGALNCQLILR
jgi:hypothetical protein